MDRRLIGVIIAAVITADASIAPQTPLQQPRPTPQTITGCLKKGNSGGFVLDAGAVRTSAIVQASTTSAYSGPS